jgi:transaldolase/glucose-6-phosphate isomerase
MPNPLLELQHYGQSVWYDFIRRSLITSGEMQKLIDQDGIRGLTSNPSIFEKAIAGSTDYDDAIAALLATGDLNAQDIFERLAVDDIQRTADLLAPVYAATGGRDGYVSLEVSPHLANETDPTIAEAHRLWAAVGRPNLMIKVPGTAAGIPAIRRLIGDGVNVNVTLLFAREVYETVVDAYIGGLEQRTAAGRDVSRVASVASFFVSRIDTLVDHLIERSLASVTDLSLRATLQSLLGKVAIANAKLAYVAYGGIFRSDRWRTLATRGAQTQRLLWASTSTKNPSYRDTIYVDELIGPETVNTVPVATLQQFRDQGHARLSLTEGIQEAHDTMTRLAEVGISMEEVTTQLVEQGVKLFADAFDALLGAIEQKRQAQLGPRRESARRSLDS